MMKGEEDVWSAERVAAALHVSPERPNVVDGVGVIAFSGLIDAARPVLEARERVGLLAGELEVWNRLRTDETLNGRAHDTAQRNADKAADDLKKAVDEAMELKKTQPEAYAAFEMLRRIWAYR